MAADAAAAIATWSSVDPRTNEIVAYDARTTALLEAAHKEGRPHLELLLGSKKFKIVFSEMRQYNDTGGHRRVQRRGPPAAPRPPPTAFTASDLTALLSIIRDVDVKVAEIVKNEAVRAYRPATALLTTDETHLIVTLYDQIMSELRDPAVQSKYGGVEEDTNLLDSLTFGIQVPNYFANAVEQSIYQRKILSVAGLRNLIKYGPDIFFEMRDRLFSSNFADYADKTGPHKMRYFTGNAVDLDTPVLKLHERQQQELVNQMLVSQGKPKVTGVEQLMKHPDVEAMARQLAQTHIDAFRDALKITDAEALQRQLVFPATPAAMPVASGNKDRGRWPVWLYHNVGITSFHANVPTMTDVYGSILLAPFHLAKCYALVLLHLGATATPQARQAAMLDFFEDCVSDSCFNGKWKAIEAYRQKLEKRGTITDVIDQLQQTFQSEFRDVLARGDDQRSQERNLILRKVADLRLVGRDASGVVRPVTAADVDAWILATT